MLVDEATINKMSAEMHTALQGPILRPTQAELDKMETHDINAWMLTDDDAIWDAYDILLGVRDRISKTTTIAEYNTMCRSWYRQSLHDRDIVNRSITRLRAGEYSSSDDEE